MTMKTGAGTTIPDYIYTIIIPIFLGIIVTWIVLIAFPGRTDNPTIECLWVMNKSAPEKTYRCMPLPPVSLDAQYIQTPHALIFITSNGSPIKGIHLNEMEFITINESGTVFIRYHQFCTNFSAYTRAGNRLFNYSSVAYPRISPTGDTIALLTTDGNSIGFIDIAGNERMPIHFAGQSLIDLNFAHSTNRSVAGFLDGTILCFDGTGKETSRVTVQNSAYTYVKCTAISENGKWTAAVANLQPELLSCYKNGRKKWSVETGGNSRTKVPLTINVRQKTVYLYEDNLLFGKVLRNGRKRFTLPITDALPTAHIGTNNPVTTHTSYFYSSFSLIPISKKHSLISYTTTNGCLITARLQRNGKLRRLLSLDATWSALKSSTDPAIFTIETKEHLYCMRMEQ